MDIAYQLHVANFEQKFNEHMENKVSALRNQFVKDFTKDRILRMEIDEYVNGKGNKSTFCNRIETELKELGNMKGSTARKFGIYFGKYGKDTELQYRIVGKLGDTLDQAFDCLKREIVDLIELGDAYNINKIKQNKISPMLKGKILSIYYPKNYLNVYSSSHLDYFIGQLNLMLTFRLSEIEKQQAILAFKNNDDILRGWSLYKFTKFLYYLFGSPTSNSVKGVITAGDKIAVDEIYPLFSNVKATLIELKSKKIPVSPSNQASNDCNRKTDFDTKNRNNKRLGDRGELIVFQFEQNKLKNCRKSNLVKEVRHIAKNSDTAGYDILSFDENGNEIYIEVKSTRSKQGDANFFLTANELECAKGNMNYWVYIVFEAHTISPKIWRINNPFELNKDQISIIPIAYKVSIGVE